MGRLLKFVSPRPAVVAAEAVGHAVAPAAHTGATKADWALPANRIEALAAIYSALFHAGWREDEARKIMQLADEGMAELVAQAALHVHTSRLERAMPGITLAGA